MERYHERISYYARRYLEALDSLEHGASTAGREDLPLIAAVCTVLDETDGAIEDAFLEHELCR